MNIRLASIPQATSLEPCWSCAVECVLLRLVLLCAENGRFGAREDMSIPGLFKFFRAC